MEPSGDELPHNKTITELRKNFICAAATMAAILLGAAIVTMVI
jgi:hypothetical protein